MKDARVMVMMVMMLMMVVVMTTTRMIMTMMAMRSVIMNYDTCRYSHSGKTGDQKNCMIRHMVDAGSSWKFEDGCF